MSETLEKELVLRELYYSPKTGYRSAEHLYQLAQKENTNITRNFVKDWLQHQDSYTKHKQYSRPQYFRHTFVCDLGEQSQVDLVTMTQYKDQNDGYQYILSAIEILSRYAFTIPVKSKSGEVTLAAFKIFLRQFEERFHTEPKLIQWDLGAEFLNKNMKKFLETKDITEFSTHSRQKQVLQKSVKALQKSR